MFIQNPKIILKVDEGRNWYSAHRGRLWIHAASKAPSDEEVRQVQDFYKARYGSKWYEFCVEMYRTVRVYDKAWEQCLKV